MSKQVQTVEQKIAAARVPGLIRAIAAAENRAAIATARGKAAASADASEALALRAELARVLAVAQPVASKPAEGHAQATGGLPDRDLKPENVPQIEDAGVAAEAVLPRRDPRLEALRRELAAVPEDEAPLRWPEREEGADSSEAPKASTPEPAAPPRDNVLPLRPAALERKNG